MSVSVEGRKLINQEKKTSAQYKNQQQGRFQPSATYGTGLELIQSTRESNYSHHCNIPAHRKVGVEGRGKKNNPFLQRIVQRKYAELDQQD